MIPVHAPRFFVTECNSEREREFIEGLHARAELGQWYADTWARDDRFVLSISLSDPQMRCVLRDLRVDFDGVTLWTGPDETHQFVTDLDPARPGVTMVTDRPIGELSALAADYLETEMRRPIVRWEWDRAGQGVARLWLFSDTNEPLIVQSRREPGLPDRIVPVRN
jgi:hypothetical protein